MAQAGATKFSRYAAMTAEMARTALSHTTPTGRADVTLGLAPAAALLDNDAAHHPVLPAGLRALAAMAAGPDRDAPRLADGSGQAREVYFPLVLHLHLRAFAKRYESLPQRVWMACEDVLPAAIEGVRSVENHTDQPASPTATALVLWQGLCLAGFAEVTRRDVDMEVADAVVHQALAQPGAGGSLHARSADEALDAWTYRELCGMHALANLALLRRNSAWARRVQEVAAYHMEHTQPDYTTTQPWGVFAALWSDTTVPFAEQQLHDVASAQATSAGEHDQHAPMIVLLLADAADALARFP